MMKTQQKPQTSNNLIDCKYLHHDHCLLASQKAGMSIPTYADTCRACLSGKSVLEGLIIVHKHNLGILQAGETFSNDGPGTQLKKLINWFPVPGKHGCRSCQNLEARMNRWGPEICEQKMDYIICKLKVAAQRRSLPFSEFLATALVKKAIRIARRGA